MTDAITRLKSEAKEDLVLLDLFLAALAIVAFGLSLLQLTGILADNEEMPRLLEFIDVGICFFFFSDFLRSLIIAPDRWRYLRTWGWFDLLSSIPIILVPHAIFGHAPAALRLVRILRVLRALRSIRILFKAIRDDRSLALLAGLLMAGITLFVGSCIGVLWAETRPTLPPEMIDKVTLKTAGDTLWWAVVTSSTVGYGDMAPVTSMGRVFAFGLMVVGIGAFATLTSTLGVLIGRSRHREREPIEEIYDRLERLERTLERVEHHLDQSEKESAPESDRRD